MKIRENHEKSGKDQHEEIAASSENRERNTVKREIRSQGTTKSKAGKSERQ
jgi:hypothetical protein